MSRETVEGILKQIRDFDRHDWNMGTAERKIKQALYKLMIEAVDKPYFQNDPSVLPPRNRGDLKYRQGYNKKHDEVLERIKSLFEEGE